jgi:hypothetical protein
MTTTPVLVLRSTRKLHISTCSHRPGGEAGGGGPASSSPRSNAGRSSQPPLSPISSASSSLPSEATTRCRGPRAVRYVSHRFQ